MAQLFEYIKMALMNIRSNKGRSILTMLGIIIGISSVIMVISIGNGLSSQVSDELNNLAGGQLYFYSGGSMGDTQAGNEEAVEFTTEDFDLIEEKIDHVKGVSPNYQTYGTAQGPKGAFDAYLYGGTVAQQYLYNDPIVKGRYFTKADYESANKVCVIRENSAVAMFGTTDVLGRTFEVTIDGITMESTIVGIRQDSASSAISSMLMSFDQVEMEVPLTTMGAAFGYYVDTFQGFYVFTDGPEYAAEAAGAILRLLRSAHHVASDSNSIQMQNFNDSMSSITQVLSYITIFVVFVAAISLLVGGIQNRFDHAAVSVRICDHHVAGWCDRYYPGCAWRQCCLWNHGIYSIRITADGTCHNAVFFGRWSVLRYLSGKEGSKTESDRSTQTRINEKSS